MGPSSLRVARLAALLAGVALLAGCAGSSGLWPFGREAVPPLQAVHEVVVTTRDGGAVTAFPQYWKRNTLVLDLQGAARAGSIVLKAREGSRWPPRLAFRIRPGEIGQLEVQGDQRVVMPITGTSSQSVDLELVPSVYSAQTPQITVRWEPRAVPPG